MQHPGITWSINCAMKGIFSILLLILISHSLQNYSPAEGEEYPRIKAAAQPSEATIGIPIEYRITLKGRNVKGLKIRLPEKREYFPDRENARKKGGDGGRKDKTDTISLMPLYIIHNARRDDDSDGEFASVTITLELAYYRTGKYFLPELHISDRENARIGYKIPEITVKAVNERGEFQDIEPPLELSGNYYRLVILGALILIAAVGIAFILRYLSRRSREGIGEPVVTPPIDIFMNEIGLLVEKKLIESERFEEFVIAISLIFRKFLSAQYGFDAMEMTVREIMHSLEERLTGLGFQRHRIEAGRILDLWDLTKFAEFIPSRETLNLNLESTVKLARRLSSEGVTGDRSVVGSGS
jgi:hypothetical protein